MSGAMDSMPYACGLSGPHLVLFKSLGLFSKGLSLFSRLDFSRGALLLLKCFSWKQLANISSNWLKFSSIQILLFRFKVKLLQRDRNQNPRLDRSSVSSWSSRTWSSTSSSHSGIRQLSASLTTRTSRSSFKNSTQQSNPHLKFLKGVVTIF